MGQLIFMSLQDDLMMPLVCLGPISVSLVIDVTAGKMTTSCYFQQHFNM